ncbi:hypothetical protein HanRHA438_Chr08g0361001 [Helianthus annuus]|nr:hypothetical protein HanRHA438_Chr08g0361001 [Helianthus annuus]
MKNTDPIHKTKNWSKHRYNLILSCVIFYMIFKYPNLSPLHHVFYIKKIL